MTDILIHSTVPSLFTQTESASNLIMNAPANESHSSNKYNGHVNRLRNVFTEQSLTSNDHSTKSRMNNQEEYMPNQLNDLTTKHENVSYINLNRKYSNSEQYYDFPADTIAQIRKQQRDENESITPHIIPAFLPSNVVKRMNHVNTIFVKPTKIERFSPNIQEQSKPIESPILNGK